MYSLLTLTLVLAPADVAPPPRQLGELVELQTEAGTLHGTIDLPAGQGPWPVVVLHPGSGPTDRNGNQLLLRNDGLKMLGRALAGRGIAVLRIDKRGVAASARALAKEEDIRFDHYAEDVVAWTQFLRKDPRFTKVGFVGHSEGALIGLVAAGDAKFDAFVSLCGLTRPFADLLREQLKTALPKDLYDESDKIIAELEAGRTVEAPAMLAPLFRPSVQPYLISEMKYDPLKLVADVRCPVLAVSGTTDIQVPVSDGERFAKAKPAAKHVVIDQMNHVLKRVEKTDRPAQVPTYADPSLPLHPDLVGPVAEFLGASLGR